MRLRRRNLVCGAIIVTAVAICVFWIIQRSKPRLQVLLNDRSGIAGTVSFTLTNLTTIPYDYWVLTELKTNRVWNLFPSPQVMHWEERNQVLSHQAVTFSVSPLLRPEEWRATVACSRSPGAPRTLTARVAEIMLNWNLDWLVARLGIHDKTILIPGPEMPSGIAFSSGRKSTNAPIGNN